MASFNLAHPVDTSLCNCILSTRVVIKCQLTTLCPFTDSLILVNK